MLVVKTLFLASTFGSILCGLASTWSSCNCRWEEWQEWQTCIAECNGKTYRERRVWSKTTPECANFTNCATADMGYEIKRCNEFCYNGGTVILNFCSCVTGYNGRCCKNKVNCGKPPLLANGVISGTDYTYGDTLTYRCNPDYILVHGPNKRQCNLNGMWNGGRPKCAYMKSCTSDPCLNGATCNNIPDDYECHCETGWDGKNCENDVQPPIVYNCSSDMKFYTSNMTINVSWEYPVFFDPHGHNVTVDSNYQKTSWNFPWGDFVITYTALKPFNGMASECTFNISIRPHQCTELSPPVHGSLACNGWKTDFGRFCTYFCRDAFKVPKGNVKDAWFVCASSGTWLPANVAPNCTVPVVEPSMMIGYPDVAKFKTCNAEKDIMKQTFIGKLKSSVYKMFCEKYPDECVKENVIITCAN